MLSKKNLLSLTILLILAACRPDRETDFTITPYPLPVDAGEALSMFSNDRGEVYASWIEADSQQRYRFRFSRFVGAGWSEPVTIAEGGRNWFVNWADMPRLAQYADPPSALAAFRLERNGRNPYDHHIMISQSTDGGQSWGPAFTPYEVRTPAFYGLCRLLPLPDGEMMAVWEDGRETVIEIPHSGRTVPNINGRIALRAAQFDKSGRVAGETLLDNMISELCPFDLTMSSEGPLVAYRNATDENIRDIALIRYINGAWSSPRIISQDNWKVSYFTMQGPAIDALQNQVAVAWYSAPEELAQVKIAFSDDSGETFSSPVRIDNGQPLGKVDVVLTGRDRAFVSWVEQETDGARLFVAAVTPKGRILHKEAIAEVSDKIYAGFPVLAPLQNGVLLAWKNGEAEFSPLTAVLIQ